MVSNPTVWSAPRRDPLVCQAPLDGHRSSCPLLFASCAGRFARCYLIFFLVTCVARYFLSRVMMTFSLSVLHAGVPTHLNSAIHTIFLLREASTGCGSVFSDLAFYLVVGGHASTQTCLVEPSCSRSLSCFKHVWYRFLGYRS